MFNIKSSYHLALVQQFARKPANLMINKHVIYICDKDLWRLAMQDDIYLPYKSQRALRPVSALTFSAFPPPNLQPTQAPRIPCIPISLETRGHFKWPLSSPQPTYTHDFQVQASKSCDQKKKEYYRF